MKLAGKLPKGDANGLDVAAPAMVADPRGVHVVLALVDCSKITENTDDHTKEPTARIRRVEVLVAEDKEAAEQLLRRALDRRLGKATLPLELEDEIRNLFAEVGEITVHVETGEIVDDQGDDGEPFDNDPGKTGG